MTPSPDDSVRTTTGEVVRVTESRQLQRGGTTTNQSAKTDAVYTSLGAAVVLPTIPAQPYAVEVELVVPQVSVSATAVAYIAIQSADGVTTYGDCFFYAGVANGTNRMCVVAEFPAGAAIPALRGAYKTNGVACTFGRGDTAGQIFIRARII